MLGDDLTILYRNGDGTFQQAIDVANIACGPGCCFIAHGDFDRNGCQDLVATCGSDMTDRALFCLE